jgi:hypothetical protein
MKVNHVIGNRTMTAEELNALAAVATKNGIDNAAGVAAGERVGDNSGNIASVMLATAAVAASIYAYTAGLTSFTAAPVAGSSGTGSSSMQGSQPLWLQRDRAM